MAYGILAQAASSGRAAGLLGFLPFVLIMVVVYFLMLRPQMKKQKEHTKMVAALKRGDDVVTSGGIHGRIVHAVEKESAVKVEIARGIVVTVERSSIARAEGRGAEAATTESKPSLKSDGGTAHKEIWAGAQPSAVVTSTGRNTPAEGRNQGDEAREGSPRRGRNRRFRPRRPNYQQNREGSQATPNETPPAGDNSTAS